MCIKFLLNNNVKFIQSNSKKIKNKIIMIYTDCLQSQKAILISISRQNEGEANYYSHTNDWLGEWSIF